MMRLSKALGSFVATAAALVAITAATDARADAEFTASGGSGSVTVTPSGHWHINKDAPWKVTSGDQSLGKDKWSLADGKATISGVKAGAAKVKVFVCNGDQCVNREVTVTVN